MCCMTHDTKNQPSLRLYVFYNRDELKSYKKLVVLYDKGSNNDLFK